MKDISDKKQKDPEKKKRRRMKKCMINMDDIGDEDCSALKCIKPSGKIIFSNSHWIIKVIIREYSLFLSLQFVLR